MILGIYHPAQGMGHDTGVALVDDTGRLIAAQSEERFSRVKMDGGFPFRALDALRQATGFQPRDVDAVAVPFLSAVGGLAEGARLLAASASDPAILARQLRNRFLEDEFQRQMRALGAYDYVDEYRADVERVRQQDGRPRPAGWRDFLRAAGLDRRPLVQVDHHAAHAAGAYFTSGWDEALVVTCDGVGALKSGVVAAGRAGRLHVLARTFYPHSPGEFWEAITAICGFHHMKHGGKITGLAAYGDRQAACYRVMAAALNRRGLTIDAVIEPAALAAALRGSRREDIAATAQRRLEEVVSDLVAAAVARTGLRRVALAGGVFANVRLNQCIAELPGVEEVYVFPAMGDEGLGAGAALAALAGRRRLSPAPLRDVYLGPSYDGAEIASALGGAGLSGARLTDDLLASRVAELLAAGRIVAVFRGRMEFGPRALGHRSILYQTTDAAVNDWLNKRLKRTEFMPFAPVTLAEHADACYNGLAACRQSARFMTITCACTPHMARISPAVVHLDGTARPQIITREPDPFYYDVLDRYFRATGIPSLVNTSFNMHEEPIVCTPADAVRAFQQGHLDYLAIGPFLVAAQPARAAVATEHAGTRV